MVPKPSDHAVRRLDGEAAIGEGGNADQQPADLHPDGAARVEGRDEVDGRGLPMTWIRSRLTRKALVSHAPERLQADRGRSRSPSFQRRDLHGEEASGLGEEGRREMSGRWHGGERTR